MQFVYIYNYVYIYIDYIIYIYIGYNRLTTPGMHILDSTLPFLLDFGSDYIPPWMVWVYPKPPGDGFGSSKEPGLKTHRLYNVCLKTIPMM